MTTIQSKSLEINTNAADVFSKISNFSAFGALMPEQIKNWKATETECSFEISGMASLAMKITEKTHPTRLVITSMPPSPIQFNLEFVFEDKETYTNSQVLMHVDVNSVMLMMVKKPLQNFVEMLNAKLKENCERK